MRIAQNRRGSIGRIGLAWLPMPGPDATPHLAMQLRLATYNIHAGIGADGRFDAARIVGVLREIDADILALQEVEHRRVSDHDLLEHLAAETGLRAIAGPTRRCDDRHYGNALLTRLAIAHVAQVDLSLPGREPRGALDVMLEWMGGRVQVVATHLGLRPSERRHQVQRLLGRLTPDIAEHTVLLGDINEWLMWGRPLLRLRRHFTATPHARTFPARWPLFALDRIWVRPRAALSQVRAHDTPLARIASDHLPLKAVLTNTLPKIRTE